MFVFNIILVISYVSVSQCKVPDKVYCVNNECSEPISKAKTLLPYNAADPDFISYPRNAEVLIFMKSAGTNSDLWYATINGKSGFVNSKFMREYKILQKNPQFIVPYEKAVTDNIVQPDKVKQAHEVVDGTTIYTTETSDHEITTEIPDNQLSLNENVTPSLSTQIPVHSNDNLNGNNQHSEHSELTDKLVSESQNILSTGTYSKPELNVSHEIGDSNLDHNENYGTKNKISIETESSENESQEESVHDNENLSVHNVLESFDQPQNYSPEMQLIEQADTNESKQQKDPANNEDKQKSDTVNLENKVEIENDNNLYEENSQEVYSGIDRPESEQVIMNSENTIKEPIIVAELLNDTETISSQENNNYYDKTSILNNLSDAQNGQTINSIESASKIENNIETSQNNQKDNIAGIKHQLDQDLVEKSVKDNVLAQNQINEGENTQSTETKPKESNANIPEMEYPHNNVAITTDTNQHSAPAENKYGNYQENTNTNDHIIQNTNENSVTTETLPPIFSTISPIIQSDEITNSQSKNSHNVDSDINTNEQGTHSEITNKDETSDLYIESTTSTLIDNDFVVTTPEPYSETNEFIETPESQSEKTEGVFSNMISTISDMWPITTESPKSIYNTEEYTPYEKTTVDGEESFSFIKYIMSVYSSVMASNDQTKALFATAGETCFTNEYCDGASTERNNRLLTFLLTTACSVLLFTLGYYYIDIKRQDGRLIGTINSLQRDLLFTKKECEILNEELANTKNKLAGIEDNSFGMDDMVQSLKEEINELKAQNERLRNSLDANEKLLRVSENTAGELQNTLSEVENTLSELFAERANSEEQITELNGKIQAFEEELISVSRERDNFQLKYVSAETALEDAKKQTKQLEEFTKMLADAKNTIELQKHEITALKDALKDLKTDSSSNVDVSSIIDHSEIKAKLAKALEERNNYASKYEEENKERSRLVEELHGTKEMLRTSSQQAAEATTRLEVLGKYFQERESELMKELSSKESLWLSKQGESASTVEKIELLQQEVQRYKEKCDALTLELAEQESTRRTAVSEVEARAHSAWLEARTARREADAARDEAATLRRKLASLTTGDGAVSPHHKVSSPLDSSENPVIPPPLPPLAFLPPPLLPPLPRPPPLGRLPSPHPPRYNDRRYSPDSRYSPESRYSPDSRYSPGTARYSPDSRYSPGQRRTSYPPRSRRRSRDRYQEGRGSRSRNVPDTETEYPSDSPSRDPRRRNRYSRHSGPSSGSGCSSESDK